MISKKFNDNFTIFFYICCLNIIAIVCGTKKGQDTIVFCPFCNSLSFDAARREHASEPHLCVARR